MRSARVLGLAAMVSLSGCNAVFGLDELDRAPVDAEGVDATQDVVLQDSRLDPADGGADGTVPDTTLTDTASSDTSVADATADTFVRDTFVADTFVPDTFVPDTFVADTFVADTFVADTFIPDTFIPDTGADAGCTEGTVRWSKTLVGPKDESVFFRTSIAKTGDGNFVLTGTTTPVGGTAPEGYLLKLSPAGDKLWERSLNAAASADFGTTNVSPSAVHPLSDGFLVCGNGVRNGGCTATRYCAWCARTDASGTVSWVKGYGGTKNDISFIHAIAPAESGAIMTVGTTTDTDSWEDGQTIKVTYGATASFTRTTFYRDGEDQLFDVRQASDGTYWAAGYMGRFRACQQPWLVHFNAAGAKLGELGTGPCLVESSGSVYPEKEGWLWGAVPRADGSVVVAGYVTNAGNKLDAFIARVTGVDTTPSETWRRYFGGAQDDRVMAIEPLDDGGFLLVGSTQSTGAGGKDLWVVRTDASGNALWQKTVGGAADEEARTVIRSFDGSYLIVGTTTSVLADGGPAGGDLMLVNIQATCP